MDKLEGIMLSEMNQEGKTKYCMTYMCNLKYNKPVNINKTSDSQIQSKPVVTVERGIMRIGKGRCKPLCVLHNTGNITNILY